MNPGELLELIKTLKEAGITHFKQGDLELSFAAASPTPVAKAHVYKPSSLKTPPAEPEDQPPHIVQEMTSLLKLSNEDLLERIFPLPQQDVEA